MAVDFPIFRIEWGREWVPPVDTVEPPVFRLGGQSVALERRPAYHPSGEPWGFPWVLSEAAWRKLCPPETREVSGELEIGDRTAGVAVLPNWRVV